MKKINGRGRTPRPRYYPYLSQRRRSSSDLAIYTRRYRRDFDLEDSYKFVLQLLCDLRHYCDVHRIDFHRRLDTSYSIYLQEIRKR